MSGYGITCDPGDLYNRKCYVTDPTDPSKKQEIIGYTAGGDPISKGQSTVPWMAWVPTLTTLDLSGNAYQPYGQAGIPYTQSGSTTQWMPSSGADMQDYTYLDQSMPGSFSRWMTENRLCNPLWSNVFGCRTSEDDSVVAAENYGADDVEPVSEQMNGYIEPTYSMNPMVPILAAAGIGSIAALVLRNR
ncbi:MAG TPA: hypothetical protein EYF95_08620 [Flavobacteriales bacterium]|nr:hypothetical protein [Flavobacteriales bacterium]